MSQVSRIVSVIVFDPKKLQRSSKEVPQKFQRRSKEDPNKFWISSKEVPRGSKKVPKKFQKSFKKVPKKFQKSSKKDKNVSKKFQKSFNKLLKKVQSCQKIVRSCLLITLIKCLKGHKSLGSLFVCQNQKLAHWVTQSVTMSPIELSDSRLDS